MSDPTKRTTPAKTPEEWGYLWEGARSGHEFNRAFGPLARIVLDWRYWAGAIATGVAVAVMFSKPEFRAAVLALIGGGA